MRGPKPKPTYLKIIEGNPGKRPIHGTEPMPEREIPPPPPELNDDARAEWEAAAPELYRLGLISRIDRSAFSAYCDAVGVWTVCNRHIKAAAAADPASGGGLLVKGENGNWFRNPLVGIARQARVDAIRYAAEFGMTPSARARLDSATPRAANKFAGLIGKEAT